jgi:hypothetical protein
MGGRSNHFVIGVTLGMIGCFSALAGAPKVPALNQSNQHPVVHARFANGHLESCLWMLLLRVLLVVFLLVPNRSLGSCLWILLSIMSSLQLAS